MSLADFPGGFCVPYGSFAMMSNSLPVINATAAVIDAVNEAAIYIDTSGSSSIGWLCSLATFANAGTTVKVGIGDVDMTNGPPGRAVNVADVITMDVFRSMVGGSGDITAAWKEHVPTSGSKTIAHGQLVALSVQMTARGGSDAIRLGASTTSSSVGGVYLTSFASSTYSAVTAVPNAVITYSDGTLGWFFGADIATLIQVRTYNSGSSPNEYGQLFIPSVPMRIAGLFCWVDPDADFDLNLYSDPLGTPVRERFTSHDPNVAPAATGRRFVTIFDSPYDADAGEAIAITVKPTSVTGVATYFKTLHNAAYRVTDPMGATGYGVSRASGAFANANSSLDHYYLGLLLGGGDDGTGGGGGGGGGHFSAHMGISDEPGLIVPRRSLLVPRHFR